MSFFNIYMFYVALGYEVSRSWLRWVIKPLVPMLRDTNGGCFSVVECFEFKKM